MSRIRTKYLADNAVTNAKLSQVATQTFKGRTTAGTGNVEDLSATQATAILNAFTGDSGSGGVKGLVPAPAAGDAAANKFLKADGTWATAGGGSATPTIFGSRSSPRSIVAATGITTGAGHMSDSAAIQDIYVQGSITGNSVAATITAGTVDGQRMTLIGRSDTQTVTLNSTTTNFESNGPVTLGSNDTITLRWDTSVWHEVARS